jgi:hypothetical protein
MAKTKWLDRTQPQTLYMATLLLYFNAALSLLFTLIDGGTIYAVRIFGVAHVSVVIGLLLIVGQAAAGWGIANEKKWGYIVAVICAVLLILQTISFFYSGALLNLIFEVALLALLLHPQSREYRRVWFR